jgi:hypothetical protein
VIYIFKPFEIRAGDTTTIYQKIWGDDNTLRDKIFFSCVSCWSIGTFENSFALQLFSVIFVNTLLCCCWNQIINFVFHEFKWVFNFNTITFGISDEGFVID